eukprot:TRINITY_DN11966_c2_g1_i3.p2 TRINITY_DN11966_c2_g1~~TRINITY_DN11966_c2_g1_i3.p2  ORF type:complete len:122 (-),score=6.17 TRINITY_DN11966_c2_g1_i3:816-1181(-)
MKGMVNGLKGCQGVSSSSNKDVPRSNCRRYNRRLSCRRAAQDTDTSAAHGSKHMSSCLEEDIVNPDKESGHKRLHKVATQSQILKSSLDATCCTTRRNKPMTDPAYCLLAKPGKDLMQDSA